MAEEEPTVVWRRPFDPAARGRRRRKLLLGYGLPVAVVLAIAFAIGGSGAFFGLLILLGLIGLLLAAWCELLSLNERMNPEIRIEDGTLVVGRKRVRIAEAEAWTTTLTRVTASGVTPNVASHRFQLANLLIRVPVGQGGQRSTRPDGGPAYEIATVAWPAMDHDGLEGVRRALEPHMPAPWVPPDRIREG